MVNIDMWRHPKYYKELRKRNKSDQVISPRVATASARRAPDSGQELGKVQPWDREATPSSKRQATSLKPQAASHKRQATSNKLQASGQASSNKR
jgi:hypothetical protein